MVTRSIKPPEHRRIDEGDNEAIEKAIADSFEFVGTIHHYEKPLFDDEVSILSGTDDDQGACIEIALSVFKHSRFFSVSKELAYKVYHDRISDAFDQMHVFVAVPNAEPHKRVGFAVLDGNDIPLIAVAKDYQRRGIGKMLLDELSVQCRARGYKSVTVSTQGGNYEAHRLYQKNGFNKTKIEKDFHK